MTSGEFITKMITQFGGLNKENLEGMKVYIGRYSENELEALWKRFDGYYDSDRAPTSATLRKMAADAGLKQSKFDGGAIKQWVLRCNLCSMHKAENQSGVCPHCDCNSYYTIVATDRSPSEMNQGRRLSMEEYKAIHHAHPRLVTINKAKRTIPPEAEALILAMCDYAGDGKEFFDSLRARQQQKQVPIYVHKQKDTLTV